MAPKRKQRTTSPSSSSSKAKSAAAGSSSSSPPPKKTRPQQVKVKQVKASEESDFAEEPELEVVDLEDEDGAEGERSSTAPTQRMPKRRAGKKDEKEVNFRFLNKPIPEEEARRCWPYRFQVKAKGKQVEKGGFKSSNGDDDSDELIEARFHFRRAQVDGYIYNLEDDAYVQGEDGKDNYICKIVEMFEAVDGVPYFRAQWFYRTRDTVITECHEELIDAKRVFFSEVQNDNFLDCLVKPLNIARLPNMDLKRKKKPELNFDYYYDMMYLLPHCTFMSLRPDDTEGAAVGSESDSTISSETDVGAGVVSGVEVLEEEHQLEMTLLDLYSGCGAMSTGLSLGANSAGVKLVTKWALDLNKYACKSLKWNHPETEVANEYAHNYLCLLQEWQMLCASFSLVEDNILPHPLINVASEGDDSPQDDEDDEEDEEEDSGEVFEVEKVLDICYGDPKENKSVGLHFKIRWKGYGSDYDTWEPIEGLSNCHEKVKDFVTKGYQRKFLPLPGMVDVICGGPPCQGISGFNRFRNKEEPLQDEKNKQLVVFMDIVAFLKPRYVLMENVVDLFKFARGYLGRYAFARLVQMNYQARLGLMAAGAYGLAQFRMRAFLWAALPTENLPQYPLPTHDVVVRGNVPVEFESCFVAHEVGHKVDLEEKLLLKDVISDLPTVENDESRDELQYDMPKTEFQKFIRLRKDEMPGSLVFGSKPSPHLLYDHRPLQLNDDDYSRVCRIPKKKGANFRDLPGLIIGPDNKVELDPEVERELLPSGKPLVPDYAVTFMRGTSSKPFGRLWWDETVPTVVTRAEPHNQVICHPTQDRVLSIRENARLQGFPDYYKLFGPIKERYIQVGNAVAVPVARALGHSLAWALKGLSGKEPVYTLPKKFPNSEESNPDMFA